MNKITRVSMACIMMLIVVFVFSACKNESPSPASLLVGKWTITQGGNTITMSFKSDGTFTQTLDGSQTGNGTFTTDGSILKMVTASSTIPVTVKNVTATTATISDLSYTRDGTGTTYIGTWKYKSAQFVFTDTSSSYSFSFSNGDKSAASEYSGNYTGTLPDLSITSSQTNKNSYTIAGDKLIIYNWNPESPDSLFSLTYTKETT